MENYMTVDFEEWFHGLTSTGKQPEIWDSLEDRIDIGADFLLSLFEETNIKATFFIVGVLAEKRPDIVRRIVEAGHEIGLHGHVHRHVFTYKPDEFSTDLSANLLAIKSACDASIQGFRAPAFSVRNNMNWFWEKIAESGLAYSSSLFPIRTPVYGAPDAPLIPHMRGNVAEIPMSVFRIAGQNVPFSGGFYFRALPYNVVMHMTRAMNKRGEAVIFYFHPWEFDPNHPQPSGISRREKITHYTGLKHSREKLRRLCHQFQFSSLNEYMPVTK